MINQSRSEGTSTPKMSISYFTPQVSSGSIGCGMREQAAPDAGDPDQRIFPRFSRGLLNGPQERGIDPLEQFARHRAGGMFAGCYGERCQHVVDGLKGCRPKQPAGTAQVDDVETDAKQTQIYDVGAVGLVDGGDALGQQA